MHVAKGKKAGYSVKAKNKSKAEALLEQADPEALKEWVKELLTNNKDLELSFTHYFTPQQVEYTPEEVRSISIEAINAVTKSRKSLDLTELKKILQLWAGIHTPIVKSYLGNVSSENSFLNFHAIIECCMEFNQGITVNSKKVLKHAESLLAQAVPVIVDLQDEAAWKTATGLYVSHIFEGKYVIRLHYLQHLKNILAVSASERKCRLIEQLIAQYTQFFTESHKRSEYTKSLFAIVEENNLLPQYFILFKPIHYANEYNLKLIRLLIDNGYLEQAQTFSEDQITINAREDFDLPYLELLKEIYLLTKNDEGLAKVLERLFPYTYNLDDYLYIISNISNEEEKIKWRKNTLSRAKNASNRYNSAASKFVFDLMN